MKLKLAAKVFGLGLGMALIATGCASKKGKSGADATGAGGMYDPKTGGIGLGLLERIHFDFDQAAITSEAAATLDRNASTMKSSDGMRVLVEGHTDERGTNEYNIALGERRARATVDQMTSRGIARNRLEMKSWGEERPLDFAKNEAAFGLNRRAEFVILKK